MEEKLIDAIAALEEDRVEQLVKQMIDSGKSTFEILELSCKGVELVGEKYRFGTYYLSDLIMASEIFQTITNLLEPHINVKKTDSTKVKVLMGTIHGDIHDLGKNITIFMLLASGYDVYDLGVNVPPEDFVKAIEKTGAQIIGISVVLTFCMNEVKKLVDILKESGLRDRVKIVVGGFPVNKAFSDYIGSDYYSNDAAHSIKLFNQIAADLENNI